MAGLAQPHPRLPSHPITTEAPGVHDAHAEFHWRRLSGFAKFHARHRDLFRRKGHVAQGVPPRMAFSQGRSGLVLPAIAFLPPGLIRVSSHHHAIRHWKGFDLKLSQFEAFATFGQMGVMSMTVTKSSNLSSPPSNFPKQSIIRHDSPSFRWHSCQFFLI